MPSDTTAESSDSIAPSTAIVMAAGTSIRHSSSDKTGQCGAGKELGISPNCDPKVAMPHRSWNWNITDAKVTKTTTAIEPGTNRPIFLGQNQIARVARVAKPTVGQFG